MLFGLSYEGGPSHQDQRQRDLVLLRFALRAIDQGGEQLQGRREPLFEAAGQVVRRCRLESEALQERRLPQASREPRCGLRVGTEDALVQAERALARRLQLVAHGGIPEDQASVTQFEIGLADDGRQWEGAFVVDQVVAQVDDEKDVRRSKGEDLSFDQQDLLIRAVTGNTEVQKPGFAAREIVQPLDESVGVSAAHSEGDAVSPTTA